MWPAEYSTVKPATFFKKLLLLQRYRVFLRVVLYWRTLYTTRVIIKTSPYIREKKLNKSLLQRTSVQLISALI